MYYKLGYICTSLTANFASQYSEFETAPPPPHPPPARACGKRKEKSSDLLARGSSIHVNASSHNNHGGANVA